MIKPLPTDDEIANLVRVGKRHRRIAGAAIGAGLGLVYGLVSQGINSVVIPGIPFYQPPFGLVTDAVLCLVAGALLGLVSAWPQESVLGIVAAGVVGALVISAVAVMDARPDWKSSTGVILIALLLPMSALVAVIVASLRWAANKQEDSYRVGHLTASAVLAPLILLAVAGGLAATVLYPPIARPMLVRTNAMVQDGLAASNAPALPPPLQGEAMGGFLDHARGAYTLEWSQQFDRYGMIMRPGADLREQGVVVVRFESGWAFACLFATPQDEPVCKSLQQ